MHLTQKRLTGIKTSKNLSNLSSKSHLTPKLRNLENKGPRNLKSKYYKKLLLISPNSKAPQLHTHLPVNKNI